MNAASYSASGEGDKALFNGKGESQWGLLVKCGEEYLWHSQVERSSVNSPEAELKVDVAEDAIQTGAELLFSDLLLLDVQKVHFCAEMHKTSISIIQLFICEQFT